MNDEVRAALCTKIVSVLHDAGEHIWTVIPIIRGYDQCLLVMMEKEPLEERRFYEFLIEPDTFHRFNEEAYLSGFARGVRDVVQMAERHYRLHRMGVNTQYHCN